MMTLSMDDKTNLQDIALRTQRRALEVLGAVKGLEEDLVVVQALLPAPGWANMLEESTKKLRNEVPELLVIVHGLLYLCR